MPPASFPFTIVCRMRYAHLGLLFMFSARAMLIWAYYLCSAHVLCSFGPIMYVQHTCHAYLGLLFMFSTHAMRIWAYYVCSAHVQHAIISLYIGLHSCHLHRLHNLQLNTVSVFATQFLFK